MVVALVLALLAHQARRALLRHIPPFESIKAMPASGGRDVTGALVAALLLFALGGISAAVNDKVKRSEDSPRPQSIASEEGFPLQHLSAFSRPPTVHSGPLSKKHCLVRYFERQPGRDPGANWWTTCAENRRLDTVAEVRDRLALPKAWGSRNGRVWANLPAGERVTFVAGRAARQCEPGGRNCYRGGGKQLLFRDRDFQRAWFTRYECARGPETAAADFRPCVP